MELEMQRSGLENPLVSRKKEKKMCSDVSDKVKDVYSNVSDNTCGDGCTAFPQKT